jgi:hypothetical protein
MHKACGKPVANSVNIFSLDAFIAGKGQIAQKINSKNQIKIDSYKIIAEFVSFSTFSILTLISCPI